MPAKHKRFDFKAFLFCYSRVMAAPITHILFAIEMDENISKDFILGTSFPDIRYLGVIDRDATHGYTLDNLTDTSSFISGMAFHQYVDIQREEYWKAQKVHTQLPDSPYITHALKFLEDIVLYEYYKDWSILSTVFDQVIEDERAFQISDTDIYAWHQIIKEYIVGGPSLDNIIRLTKKLVGGDKISEAMSVLIPELEKNEMLKIEIKKYFDIKRSEFQKAI